MTIEQYKVAACLAKTLHDLCIIDFDGFIDVMERLGND